MKRTGELSRKTPLRAKAPMNRKREKRSAPRRQAVNDSRWRSEAYLRWVRQQSCARCGAPADDAHHVIGLGWQLSGMGLTAPDNIALPACRACHQDIHGSPELQRYQPNWLRWVWSGLGWCGPTNLVLCRLNLLWRLPFEPASAM